MSRTANVILVMLTVVNTSANVIPLQWITQVFDDVDTMYHL